MIRSPINGRQRVGPLKVRITSEWVTGCGLGTHSVTARVDDGRSGNVSCVAEIRVDPRPNQPPIRVAPRLKLGMQAVQPHAAGSGSPGPAV